MPPGRAYTPEVSTSLQATAAQLAGRRATARAELGQREAQVRARLPAAAALLRDVFGAENVWLFGSYALGRLHAGSDVDLAVEGIPPTMIDRAHGAVEALLDATVDLVPVEQAPERLRMRLRAEGVRL